MLSSRRRVSRASSALRGRLTLLVLSLVLLGSPWVQQPIWDRYERKFYIEASDSTTLRRLFEAAFVPRWDTSSARYGTTSGLVVNDLAVLFLIAGLAFFLWRMTARGRAGRIRCLVVGLSVPVAANLLWWGLHTTFVSGVPLGPSDEMLDYLLPSGLLFGLVAGALLLVVTTGLPRGGGSAGTSSIGAVTAPLRRWREGGLGMTTAPVHMPVGSAPGDVTRYLCAAAYVDEGFAERVVEDVLADEAGAVAASPDVDLVAVVRHCLTAQELRQRRDLRLTAAFAAVGVFAPLWLLFVTVFLSTTRQAVTRPSLATRGRHQPQGRALVGTAVAAGFAVVLAFALGFLVSMLPAPGFVSWLLGSYLAGVPAALLSVAAVAYAYATVVRHDLDVDRLLRTTMTREAFARQPRPTVPRRKWMAERLAAIREAQDGNVTVYSGFTPFIGYARSAAQWSLAVPLLPADGPVGGLSRPGGPEAFTVAELVDQVRARLRTTAAAGGTADAADAAVTDAAQAPGPSGSNGTAGTHVPAGTRGPAGAHGPAGSPAPLDSLVIEDRVFASGTGIGEDERFIRTRSLAPVARLSADEVERIMEHPTGTVRHHLAVHVPLWGGDVVPSLFLHFSTTGRTLHLHCSNHVLGPVRAEYHVVDRLRGPLSPSARRGLLLDAVPRTGKAFYAAPFRALRQAYFDERHSRRMVDELRALEQDPVYDFGARVSVRELALSPDYQNYFQVVDAARITALVERHTLAAIREFLEARGYDITDFRAQQQTILNQGLIQQGGTSIIGNQAIGAGASATQNFPQQQSGPSTALGAVGGPGPGAASGSGT
ncbi:collagen-like protein [Streptomyces griseorubiginosus]|uniref:collagen-like triple helix repeat-containing protein n=1 Tax=Streptomyces griseorubiginosus TaxID=67304 RepID=UPI00362E2E67